MGDFVEVLAGRGNSPSEPIICLVQEYVEVGTWVATAIAPRFSKVHGVRDGDELLIHEAEILRWLVVQNEAQRQEIIDEAKQWVPANPSVMAPIQ